jgi:hypothetical protein
MPAVVESSVSRNALVILTVIAGGRRSTGSPAS